MKLDIKRVVLGLVVINTVLILIVAPMIGMGIVVVLLIGAGYLFFVKRKNANKSQSETELEKYLESIKASRSVPIIIDTGLKLEQGENVFLYEKVLFLNMANKEFGVKKQKDDKSHHPKYPGFIESDKGDIALTNLRVIFRGEKNKYGLTSKCAYRNFILNLIYCLFLLEQHLEIQLLLMLGIREFGVKHQKLLGM